MDRNTKVRIVGIIGLIMLFPNLIMWVLRVLEIYESNLASSLVILLLFVVGSLMAFISTIMVREERRKERESQCITIKN
jgi:hypothetical protein